MEKQTFPRPDWSPLPRQGCVNVNARVLLRDPRSFVAILHLEPAGSTDVHPAPYDIHVLCIEGSGYATCADEEVALQAGETVLWPKDQPHNLFTTDSAMTTIMIEHVHQISKE